MNKKFVMVSLAVLAFSLSLIQGCSRLNQTIPKQNPTIPQPSVNKQEIIIGVEGLTGDYYVGSGIAAILNKNLDYLDAQCKVAADQVNYVQKLTQGEFHFGIISSGLVGQTGLNSKIITPLYANVFQCLVRKNSGLKKLDDLKGRRVAVGLMNSEGEKLTRAILASCGIPYGSFTPLFSSYAEAGKEFTVGNLDCIIINEKIPSNTIAELSANLDTTLLAIDDRNLNKITQKVPFYEGMTIAPRTYKGLEDYIPTVSTTALLVGGESLGNDTVYAVTKAIYENLYILESFHPLGKEFKSGYENKDTQPLPYHPGAMKYYVERQMLPDKSAGKSGK